MTECTRRFGLALPGSAASNVALSRLIPTPMEYRTRGRVSIAPSGILINPIPSPLLHIGWSMHSFRVDLKKVT